MYSISVSSIVDTCRGSVYHSRVEQENSDTRRFVDFSMIDIHNTDGERPVKQSNRRNQINKDEDKLPDALIV